MGSSAVKMASGIIVGVVNLNVPEFFDADFIFSATLDLKKKKLQY